jgi:hypothetical protein
VVGGAAGGFGCGAGTALDLPFADDAAGWVEFFFLNKGAKPFHGFFAGA